MKEKLLEYLAARVSEYHSTAEECFQELSNPEDGDSNLAKAQAIEEVIDYINTNF
jgi:hypothetical protein